MGNHLTGMISSIELPSRDTVYATAASGRQRAIGIVLGLWLTGIFFVSLIGRLFSLPGLTSLMAGSVLWPLCYFAFSSCSFIPRFPRKDQIAALSILFIFACLSVSVSPVALESLAYLLLTFAAFFLSLQFHSNMDEKGFLQGLRIFALFGGFLIIGFAVYDYRSGQRLGNGTDILNPNTVAIISAGIILAATCIRRIILRFMLMLPLMAALVLTGSRTSAIATFLALIVVFWIRSKSIEGRKKIVIWGLISVSVLMFAFNTDFVTSKLSTYYDIHDKYRGVDSGFTGRVKVWGETWDLFVRSPIIGVGFRAHDRLIRLGTSSHNGYLAMLAEIGVFGFAAAIYLAVTGISALWKESRRANKKSTSALMGLCIGYLILAMFERFFFNIGNPTSLLFILGIIRPAA